MRPQRSLVPARVHRSLAWLCLVPVILLVLSLSAAPLSAQQDQFEVRDVPVDATAATAAEARERAVAAGQREALRRLLVRLTGSDDALGRIDPGPLVQGIEVQEERTSAVRYVGTIAVAFQPSAVRRALSEAGVSYVEAASRPALVLPVVIRTGTGVLWEIVTPWRSAWNLQPQGGLVPILLPFGELADVTDAPTQEVVEGRPVTLTTIGQRYGAGSVFVAAVTLDGTEEPQGAFTVTLLRHEPGSLARPQESTLRVEGRGDPWARAVAAVKAAIDSDWRETATVAPGAERTLVVVVPMTGLDSWIEARRRLARVSQVTGAIPLEIGRTTARVELKFRGTRDQLRTALERRGLLLEGNDPLNPPQLRLAGL